MWHFVAFCNRWMKSTYIHSNWLNEARFKFAPKELILVGKRSIDGSSVPASCEDISRGWLQTALTQTSIIQAANFSLKSFKWNQFEQVKAFLSSLMRLEIEYSENITSMLHSIVSWINMWINRMDNMWINRVLERDIHWRYKIYLTCEKRGACEKCRYED